MIYSLFIFHRNRCIFIAQYPQRGSNPPAPVGADPATATITGAPQQQPRSNSSARGSSARTGGGGGAGAGLSASAAQQASSVFPNSVSLQLRASGGSTLVVASPAATAATATGAAGGVLSVPRGSSSSSAFRTSSFDPIGQGPATSSWGHLTKRQQQTGRLLAGLLYSMRRFCEQIGPSVSPSNNSNSSSSSSFSSFATPNYRLHYFETPTGYGFACLSSPEIPFLSEELHHIYVSLFVELVLKSPAFSPTKQIDSPVFAEQLHSFLSSLPAWGAA